MLLGKQLQKLAVVCLALTAALGCAGVVYAGWSQTLTTNGSVATARFHVVLENEASNDSIAANDPSTTGSWNFSSIPYIWSGSTISQNIAQTTVSLNAGGDTLTISITNAYPGYYGSVACDVLNDSTIPIRITNSLSAVTASGAGAADTDINITRGGVFNSTTNVGYTAGSNKATGYITIGIGTAGGASTDPPQPGSQSYSFSITLVGTQNP